MKKLIWNDPDPIQGNDYTIKTVEGVEANDIHQVLSILHSKDEDMTLSEMADYPISITYGNGSEAEIYFSEIEQVDLIPYVGK